MNERVVPRIELDFVAGILTLAGVYALCGIAALLFIDLPLQYIEIWPAAGLATAVLIKGDRRLWPGIPIGYFILYWLAREASLLPVAIGPLQAPAPVAALAATLQALVAVTLIERRFGLPPRLNSGRDVTVLSFYAAPLSSAVSASVGSLGMYLFGEMSSQSAFGAWVDWWLGDTLGVLLVLPVALIWPVRRKAAIRWQGHPLHGMNLLAASAAAVGLVATLSLSSALQATSRTKNEKLFLGAVDRGESQLLHEYVSLKAVLNAATLDVSHTPQHPMHGLTRIRKPDPVYRLTGLEGFGLMQLVAPSESIQLSSGAQFPLAPQAQHGTRLADTMQASVPLKGDIAITYFEPSDPNGLQGRLDVQWNESLRAAVQTSYVTGDAAVANAMVALPNGLPQHRQIILQPAFHHDFPADTPTDRRNTLIGFVFLVTSPSQTFGRAVERDVEGAYLSSVRMSVQGGGPDDFVTEYTSPAPLHPPRFQKTDTVPAFQRQIEFTWNSTPWFEQATTDQTADLVLIGGFLLTAVTAGLVQVLSDREKKIRETERRWSLALEGSEIGVFDVDLGKGLGVSSESLHQLIGLPSPTEFEVGSEWRARVHPDDWERLQQADNDCIEGRTDHVLIEYRFKMPDDSWHWMRSNARIVEWDTDGNALRLLGTMTDITPLKQALELAETRQQELSSLIANAPVAMSVLSLDGTFLIVNDAFCTFAGYTRAALLGRKLKTLPNIGLTDDFVDEVRQTLYNGTRAFVTERHYIRPGGTEVDGIVTASILRSGPEEKPRIIVQIVDITEKKRLEKLKGDFVATVSHELRTPLTSISGSIALILGTMGKEMPPKATHMLDIAQKNAQRLGSLVNDLLDMQKFASGNITLDIKQADIGEIMGQSVSENDGYAKKFDVSFDLQLPETPVLADIDINRFKQVMANLMSNAAKFAPQGDKIEVSLSREKVRNKEFAHISVTDHGRGISPEFRERIFKPFSQAASSSTRDREGTGLGLVISKEIVEKLGGTIGFDSEPNVHTTFWFRIPAQPAAA